MERTRPTDHGSLRSTFCDACDRVTTHAQGRCTGCLLREENRKVGALWLAIGAAIIALALILFAAGFPLLRHPWQDETRRSRFNRHAVTALLLVVGASVAGRGLRGIVVGRSPED